MDNSIGSVARKIYKDIQKPLVTYTLEYIFENFDLNKTFRKL